MNMFKTIFTIFFFGYGISLYFLHPETWEWPAKIGPWMQQAVLISAQFMPFTALACFAAGLTLLFMRKNF